MKPVVFGCSGPGLTPDERAFFAEANPFGFILFQRNCETPEQVRKLIADLRHAVGREDAPVFIDQEGGRVARLKPPHWPSLPSMRTIGKIYENDSLRGLDAMRLHARITAQMLRGLGITGNLAPVLDLAIESPTQVIGDRSFSADPEAVAALGRAAVDTYLENGVLPCIKHLPGHGRVRVDPHETGTIVDTPEAILVAEDFAPFMALNDAPLGMNSHAIFTNLDPLAPTSLSPVVHEKVIRQAIGFDGLLLSDDMAMKAFDDPKYGSLGQAAARALEAGTDITLHCNGKMEDMCAVASALPAIAHKAESRWERALGRLRVSNERFDFTRELAQMNALTNGTT